MPTYQYTCTECGEPLEAVQSFTDAALTECPACGGRLRKVFGSVGVVFKGSGFYKTDSRSAAKSGAKAEPKSEPTKADSGSTDSSSGSGSGSAGGEKAGSGSAEAGKSAGSSTSAKAESAA